MYVCTSRGCTTLHIKWAKKPAAAGKQANTVRHNKYRKSCCGDGIRCSIALYLHSAVTGSRLCKYRHFLPHPTPPPLPLHMFFAAGGEEMEEEEEEEEGRDAWLRGTVNQVIGWRGGGLSS